MADRSNYTTVSDYTRSYENDEGIKHIKRTDVHYDCDNGHVTIVPFAENATIPIMWICHCGLEATKRNEEKESIEKVKRAKNQWEAILERRSTKELEKQLKERLELYEKGLIDIIH